MALTVALRTKFLSSQGVLCQWLSAFLFLSAAWKRQTHLQTQAMFHSGLEGREHVSSFQNLKHPKLNPKKLICVHFPLQGQILLLKG